MENFKYTARDLTGLKREGVRRGQSHLEVLSWLRAQDLVPVNIQKLSAARKDKTYSRRKVKSADLSSFCWQLTTMIEGGVPVTGAINTIAEDIESGLLKKTLTDMSDRMMRGETFSDTISQHPGVFNQLFCAMIMAGEAGGSLPYCLERLAIYFDNRDKLARKVKTAMSYPLFVLGFVSFIVVMIMTFIIPKFRVIFKQIGGHLPTFTQIYLGVYDAIVSYALFIVLALAASVAGFIAYYRTEKGHAIISGLILRIPIFGKITAQAFTSSFCRTLSTLLEAGVPVLESLNILAGMSKNDVIRTAVMRTREHIVEGSSISLSMAASGFFPNMVVKMVQVGEESGSLPAVLDKTSEYYERRVDSLITLLTSVLEPALIIIVGAIVLITVLALYLPIFSLSDVKH
jgi:type IV pilus assembly protein PilC